MQMRPVGKERLNRLTAIAAFVDPQVFDVLAKWVTSNTARAHAFAD